MGEYNVSHTKIIKYCGNTGGRYERRFVRKPESGEKDDERMVYAYVQAKRKKVNKKEFQKYDRTACGTEGVGPIREISE